MENTLVRTAELFGSKKNIVGGTNADLILETLGKIYVKSGKQTRLLDDVFKLLDNVNSGNKILTTDNLDKLKYPGDGYLVFDTKENALYISYDMRYLLIIDGIDKKVIDAGFVKKKGDTMTGQLRIMHNGAPLIVASSELVKFLNSNYLEGYDSNFFAGKPRNEIIEGYWTFNSDTLFNQNTDTKGSITVGGSGLIRKDLQVVKDVAVGGSEHINNNLLVEGTSEFKDIAQFRNNVTVDGDIITQGSIGSPMFMSGYNGYGWRFDANTNMLTVDYLVVRKAMQVFELVVNKISATNGSLWVTDSAKIEKVERVKMLPAIENGLEGMDLNCWYIPYTNEAYYKYNYDIITINEEHIKRPEEYTIIDGEIQKPKDIDFGVFKFICKYKNLEDLQDLDPINYANMENIGILFPESDSDDLVPTHFNRLKGFSFPLDHETPIFLYEHEEDYRLPVPKIEAKYYYDYDTKQYVETDDPEKAKYGTFTFDSVFILAPNGKGTHKYNTVTKTFEENNTSLAKYIQVNNYDVIVLAGDGEVPQYKWDDEIEDYISAPINEATHVKSSYRLVEGLNTAVYVYVPEDYWAIASNVFVPTHIETNTWDLVKTLQERYVFSDIIDSPDTRVVTKGDKTYILKDVYNVLYPEVMKNRMFNPLYTPKLINVDRRKKSIISDDIKMLYTYYKYFGYENPKSTVIKADNFVVITMKDDEYPPFKEGDLVRCQKFEDGNIKYYDALIVSKIGTYQYIMLTALSVFDKQTTIEYNEDGTIKEFKEVINKTQYRKTPQNEEELGESAIDSEDFNEQDLIAGPAKDDGLVRIGNLYDRDRQNSVYITSSEMDSPYIQTMSGIVRPDYTVLYGEPDFITNSRGLFKFSTKGLQIIERNDWGDSNITARTITVSLPNGEQTFQVFEDTFYGPNNNYVSTTESGEKIVILAKYNNLVRQNTNVRTRLGNLNGIVDAMFQDKQPYGYGLFADNVFLKGEFYLNNGKTVVDFAKEQAVVESEKITFRAVKNADNLFEGTTAYNYIGIWECDKEEVVITPNGESVSVSGNDSFIIKQKSNKTVTLYNNQKLYLNIDCDIVNYIDQQNMFYTYLTANIDGQYKIITNKLELRVTQTKYEFQINLDNLKIDSLNEAYIYIVIEGSGLIVFNNEFVSLTKTAVEASTTYQDGMITQRITDGISSSVTINDLKGQVSTLMDPSTGFASYKQRVDEHSSAISDLNGNVSYIKQKADEIEMGVGQYYIFENVSVPNAVVSNFNYETVELVSGGNLNISKINGYDIGEFINPYLENNKFLYIPGSKYIINKATHLTSDNVFIYQSYNQEGLRTCLSPWYKIADQYPEFYIQFSPFIDIEKDLELIITLTYEKWPNSTFNPSQCSYWLIGSNGHDTVGSFEIHSASNSELILKTTLSNKLEQGKIYSLKINYAFKANIIYPIKTNFDKTGAIFEMAEDHIGLKLKKTGIDIDEGNINLTADNTTINGDLTINTSDYGVVINGTGNSTCQLKEGEIEFGTEDVINSIGTSTMMNNMTPTWEHSEHNNIYECDGWEDSYLESTEYAQIIWNLQHSKQQARYDLYCFIFDVSNLSPGDGAQITVSNVSYPTQYGIKHISLDVVCLEKQGLENKITDETFRRAFTYYGYKRSILNPRRSAIMGDNTYTTYICFFVEFNRSLEGMSSNVPKITFNAQVDIKPNTKRQAYYNSQGLFVSNDNCGICVGENGIVLMSKAGGILIKNGQIQSVKVYAKDDGTGWNNMKRHVDYKLIHTL